MESAGIIPIVLTGMGSVPAVLLGVWGIVARDSQGKETAEQLGQPRERMAKLEGLLEGLREAITGKRAWGRRAKPRRVEGAESRG
ncbi:MAG: hypothetical protein OXG04_00160 [Acidobacteria bacterium]|nr:hypothetical protein [Acidobacteriota bacterium]